MVRRAIQESILRGHGMPAGSEKHHIANMGVQRQARKDRAVRKAYEDSKIDVPESQGKIEFSKDFEKLSLTKDIIIHITKLSQYPRTDVIEPYRLRDLIHILGDLVNRPRSY